MKHVFIIDDETSIRDLLKKYLEREGYKVTTFSDGYNVISELDRLEPDLLVLDIMMPGMDGLDLCKEIRKTSDVPIIFVSAKDEEFDRVLGLEIGGDDYLSKPFSPRELVARVKNIFKRLEKPSVSNKSEIYIDNLVVNKEKRYVGVDGCELKLTTKEYELFEFLVSNRGKPFNREQLVERIWGYDYIGDSRIIDDLVKRIRKKLSDAGSQVEIVTVWGYGYKIDG
ncbi:MAG: response regulator transcription factor [Bacillota bacterium]